MKKSEVTRLDIAEYLDSKEIVAEYLNLICQENDPTLLLRAIGHIARSKGMAKIAESSGLGRESLYKALDENSHPRFETVFKVLAALGIQMLLVPKVKPKRKRTPAQIAVTRPPSKELLEAIREGEQLARDPNAKTYKTPQELWDELGLKI
jgi:probable addiction module antidote protein